MKKIIEYAVNNYVPIMEKDGLDYLLNFILENNIQTVLELGSAIGYSAINMALLDKQIKVKTIERDTERYVQAIENVERLNLQNQIEIINDDIFNIELSQKFDLIFIDASKSHNIDFFEKFKFNLNKNGFIITDNINFHGFTSNVDNIKNKRVRQLVKKINNYTQFLKTNEDFETIFINVGDGLSVSRWK